MSFRRHSRRGRRQISNNLTPSAGRAVRFGVGMALALAGGVLTNRRWMLLLSLLISLAAVSSSSAAFAQVAPAPVSPSAPPVAQTGEPLPPTETYSAQIVAADLGALLGFLVIGSSTDQSKLLLLPPLAAPVVHGIHGHFGRAAISFALNLSLPTAGALVGFAVDSQHCGAEDWFCGLGGLVVGGFVGIASAIVIDAAVLARLPDEESPRGRTASAHDVRPLFALNRDGGLSLGLGGRF
jgi:hypothetical protein